MTINSEQIKALAARLQMKANEAKQSDDWGCDSNNFHDVATPDNILSLLADRDADKALIAELAGALEDCVYRIDCTITKGEATLLDIETARKAHALLAGITLDVGE